MAYQSFRSQFGDTTYTKVFVGGLAWETPTDKLHQYFEQFGDILEAVVITDKITGRSKGYGFVTFRDPESARNACLDPNPMIDGRRANCNIAAMGRPRPSPPRGKINPGASPYHQGGGGTQGIRIQIPGAAPPQPPPPPVIYPPYGYTAYAPEYGYHHTFGNPHIQAAPYYPQMYGASSSTVGSPYYYGYSLQSPTSRIPAFTAAQAPLNRIPSYLHYPAQGDAHFTAASLQSPVTLNPAPLPTRELAAPATTDSQYQHRPTTTTEAGVINNSSSESPEI
ncbi:hypothetical protein MKX01_037238 [Papaver californicum]|nr:hypothetical protein MKX01_037238 [Papaver californicum]